MTDTLSTIKARTSANNFDTTHVMSNADIEELVSYAQHAPTAFNLQNWRVVAFSSKAQKEALKAAAEEREATEVLRLAGRLQVTNMGKKILPMICGTLMFYLECI